MVIVSGRSTRQVAAMAEHLRERLKAAGYRAHGIEGQSQGDWVLVDAGDVIVHLFRPEIRTLYNLEKMWGMPAGEAELVAAKPARSRKAAAATAAKPAEAGQTGERPAGARQAGARQAGRKLAAAGTEAPKPATKTAAKRKTASARAPRAKD